MSARSVLATLRAAPRKFRFDAVVRILTRAAKTEDPADAARFRTPPGLVYPAADVLRLQGENRPDVTLGLMGLTGPSGVLPRHYTEFVTQTLRGRSTALHDFLDMLSHRFVAFFARAPIKYRPAPAAETAALRTPPEPDPVTQVLLALTGFGTPHLASRLPTGTEPILHYAGLFAMRPRSAERLQALVADFLGMKVEVVEFAGAWLNLPPDQRTRIGAFGSFARLGVDASAGVRAWDPQARFVLKIGPLHREAFERLLPDRGALERLVSLVRAYVGFELGFAVNPGLREADIPVLRMDSTADPAPRLGWNTWLPASAGSLKRRGDAWDAMFEAEVVEARPTARERPRT
jgi:type VI secretion system protein ImpH